MTAPPPAVTAPKVLSIVGLLRPHWKAMTLALVFVAGEAAAALVERWFLRATATESPESCLEL